MSGDAEMLNELKNFDTPSITNVVATYPTNPLCLGLYNPWSQNWYTDAGLRCWYPELGPVVGYAVTCVYGLPDPNYPRAWSLADVTSIYEARMPLAVRKPLTSTVSPTVKSEMVAGELLTMILVRSSTMTFCPRTMSELELGMELMGPRSSLAYVTLVAVPLTPSLFIDPSTVTTMPTESKPFSSLREAGW